MILLSLVACRPVTDVLVVGAGTSGAVAAIAAGHEGATVELVEASGQMGGTVTGAGVCFPGLFHAWGKQVIAGIGWELVTETVSLAGGSLPDFTVPCGSNHPAHQVLVNKPLFAALAEEKCVDAGVSVHYYEVPVNVMRCGGLWKVRFVDKNGTFRAGFYKVIVDCTGNASVAMKAGATMMDPGTTQPGSLVFRFGGYDLESLDWPVIEALWDKAFEEGLLSKTDCYTPIRNLLYLGEGLASSHVPGASCLTGASHTSANIQGRASMLKLLRVLKTFPGLENIYPVSVGSEVGIRESARILGEYTVTGDDYVSGRVFDDAVCYSFYPIDVHDADGVEPRHLAEGVVPTVPLRALVPRGIPNFLVVGRAISADREASSALRVQATSMATGQAAGTVAALSALSARPARPARRSASSARPSRSSLSVRPACSPFAVPLDSLRATLSRSGAILPPSSRP